MKKTILSAAIIFSAFVGFNSFAQTPQAGESQTCEQTACENNQNCCCSKDNKACKGKKHHKGNKPGIGHNKAGKGPRHNYFEGINLTPEQQSALNDIRPARDQRKEKTAKDGEKNISREDRMKERKAKFDEYKNKVKEILTPEQYAVFEQNVNNSQANKEGFNRNFNKSDKKCKGANMSDKSKKGNKKASKDKK